MSLDQSGPRSAQARFLASLAAIWALSAACTQAPIPAPTQGDASSPPRPEVVMVPAGPFVRGCADGDSACESDELPPREVALAAFAIDTTEVTQVAYAACVDDGACAEPVCDDGSPVWTPDIHPQRPVVCTTWEDARTYCAWAGKRLPTEAEWEKAARGPEPRIYPWGDEPPDCARANFGGCAGERVAVGSTDNASPYGALDMAGNVCEWTADWYASSYYTFGDTDDPRGPVDGEQRVLRDGHYADTASSIRSSRRNRAVPQMAHNLIGFRCAQ